MVLTGPMHYAFLKAFCVYGTTDLGFRYNNPITLIVNLAKVNIHTLFILKNDIFMNTIDYLCLCLQAFCWSQTQHKVGHLA